MTYCVSDNSAFSDIQKNTDGGFRLFNHFAVFIYSQLQNILPDNALGSVSHWDFFLSLDLDSTELPFKTADDFVLNEDFHQLVLSSKLPRPSRFIDQSIGFCKSYCKQLMAHDLVKSKLTRGLSSFDSPVMLESPEEVYVSAIEKLSGHFVSTGLLTPSDKVKVVSQYRSFVTQLRGGPIPNYDDWVHFIANHYEIQCRPQLMQLFKHSCLCLISTVEIPPKFEVPMPTLESDKSTFESCVVSLQIAYRTVSHVSSLFRDPKAVSRAFRLLGRGAELLMDRKFQIWNFQKGNNSRRTALLGKLESGYRKSVLRLEKSSVSSTSTTPSVSRCSSVNSTPSPDLTLSRVSVALSRCPETAREVKAPGTKSSKGKKN